MEHPIVEASVPAFVRDALVAESRARKRPYGTVGMPKRRRVRVWVRRVRAVTLLAGALRLERPSSRRGRRDRFGGCNFPTFS